MTAKQNFLQTLAKLPKFGSSMCLHRVSLMIERLVPSDYLANCKAIVLTGTDGKGSTSMLVNSILRAHGLSTGLFTSPHFLEFNERFQVNGENIDYDSLNQGLDLVLTQTSQLELELKETFGIFEIQFLLALVVFHQRQARVLIFEAGIGGRYDPVRCLKSPLTALTSVALEHTGLLGKTLELISYDKLDACFCGGKVILGNVCESILDKIRSYAALKNITAINASQQVTISKNGEDNNQGNSATLTVNDLPSIDITTHLINKPHCYNIQTAVALCLHFFASQLPKDFIEHCKQGIERSYLPGRFEQIAKTPEIYIDAAHTPNAYALLFNTIKNRFSDKPVIFVAGISQERDNCSLVKGLTHLASQIIVTQASFKGADPKALFEQVSAIKGHDNLTLQPTLKQAISDAKRQAQAIDGRVFVVGGLFLAAEAAAIEKNIPVKGLFLY